MPKAAGTGSGLVLSSPWVFYQLWAFVAAGLYRHERQYVKKFLPFSLGLFLGGVLLCFFGVLPLTLKFLLQFNVWLGIEPTLRISEWMSFATILPLVFGLAFQTPLVMLFLARIGIFTADDYRILHPGGSLGRKLVRVADIMHTGAELPLVREDAVMTDVLIEMTSKRFGCAGVTGGLEDALGFAVRQPGNDGRHHHGYRHAGLREAADGLEAFRRRRRARLHGACDAAVERGDGQCNF